MTSLTSDERYHNDPNKPDLGLHYFVHGFVAILYLISPFVAWAFEFHPFRQSFHGFFMWGAGLVFAMLAFGPIHNAIEQGNTRFINLYERILSPMLMVASILVFVAVWVFAFYESYAGSVFV